ncbi:methionyl-tRNA formyltransferase [Gordonia sp. (in: high G+C Gram-positive bacteria)]|uniref:methionyl-tRNA formyltransferase n=1 Tax=Gordonia sp. (in: high G+C Gram-positive bacteria) TaxID=84139 RepID=UPI00168DB093|nr:methionyl-tRNA formyltransferase [Gordonia sp. (in: high G+C Gram-positive bacteria)]NLG47463.1 methionyl-tRNA formyltransferase [Gordonia sp. (in: high G+C Gram-positive bacteria)]
MRLVFAGTPDVAVPTLKELLDSDDHEVVGVITRPDTTAGRGRRVVRSDVGTLADAHGIEVITPARMSEPEVAEALARWNADLGVVVAYGGLIPQSILDALPHGWINLHFSILPAWRGAAPVQAAIAAGDEITGASVFLLEAGLDTGPVYGTLTERIRDTDTSGDLLGRLAVSGAGLARAVIDGIEAGELVPVAQPEDGVSHAAKITTDDAHVRWDLPSHLIGRSVRAHTPAPGAWAMLGDARVKLGAVTPVDGDDNVPAGLAPGVLGVTKKAVFVGTASGAVRLSTVQAPGKKSMNAADWARGSRLDGTEKFA